MSLLKKKIEDQLKQAMKARSELAVSTYRLIRAGIKNKEIEIGKALDDAGVVAIVQKMIKQAKESLEQFQKGGRRDLVEQTMKEMEFLKPFLPAQMSLEDLKTKIKETIATVGATSSVQMGEVMKALTSKFSGRIDMKEASRLVKELLSKF